MATAKSYRLTDDVKHEGVDRGGLRFKWRGKKGQTVTAKSEREEDLLEHLVNIGVAERVKAKGGKSSSSAPSSSGEDG